MGTWKSKKMCTLHTAVSTRKGRQVSSSCLTTSAFPRAGTKRLDDWRVLWQ